MMFIVMMPFVASCGSDSDDEEGGNINSPVVGEWVGVDKGVRGVLNLKSDGTFVDIVFATIGVTYNNRTGEKIYTEYYGKFSINGNQIIKEYDRRERIVSKSGETITVEPSVLTWDTTTDVLRSGNGEYHSYFYRMNQEYRDKVNQKMNGRKVSNEEFEMYTAYDY